MFGDSMQQRAGFVPSAYTDRAAIAGKFRLAQGLVGAVQNGTAQAAGRFPASKAEYKALLAEDTSLKSQNAVLLAENAQTQALVNNIVAQVNALTPVCLQFRDNHTNVSIIKTQAQIYCQ